MLLFLIQTRKLCVCVCVYISLLRGSHRASLAFWWAPVQYIHLVTRKGLVGQETSGKRGQEPEAKGRTLKLFWGKE